MQAHFRLGKQACLVPNASDEVQRRSPPHRPGEAEVQHAKKHTKGLNRRTLRGFTRAWTLLELLLAMLLLGVLLTLGASTWAPLRQKYQLQAQAEDLLSVVLLARSEALKRGARVTACVSSDGVYCLANGDWTQGWLLFEDTDGNALRADTEPKIAAHAALPSGALATGNSPVARYVSYGPSGRSLTVSGAFQSGTLTLCRASAQSQVGWKLVINAVGKARLEAATLANCG